MGLVLFNMYTNYLDARIFGGFLSKSADMKLGRIANILEDRSKIRWIWKGGLEATR